MPGKRPVEQLKAENDFGSIWQKILRWSEEGWESIPQDELDLTKWYGLFYRKPTPGHFMIRVRLPGGILEQGRLKAVQLWELAEITHEYGRDILDVTTRQQVELRWMRVEDFPEVYRRLRSVGLDSRQTGMDNVRGVTTCPVAGLAADEVLDARPIVREVTGSFVGEWRYANLPRKFNVTVVGCRDDCTHAETNDIGLVPAVKDECYGFNVRVGGGEGAWGRQHAWPLDAFVTGDRVAELCLRVLDVFSASGQRKKRGKARLKFLIDEWGVERFQAEVARGLSFELEPAGEDLTRSSGPRDHIGVHRQREPGKYYVGLLVPTGRMKLEWVFELAQLAEEYGTGEVRLTTGQNVILPNVPEERLDALLAEPLLEELSPDPGPFLRGLVACTGKSFCPFALIETKDRGRELAEYLDERLGDEVREVTDSFEIHASGCANSCARPHTGSIGLIGKGIRQQGGTITEAADVLLGGEQVLNGGFNERWRPKVPFEELAPAVEDLIRRYLAEREPAESFREWCTRSGVLSAEVRS